jgi:hypothetical protein
VGLPALVATLIEENMAVPPGSKPKINGRTVYSQTANAIRKRKALGLGEFAEGAAADTPQPHTVEAPPEFVSPQGELSTETIGVVTTVTVPEPVAAPEEEPQRYFCENCKGTVTPGDPECSTCEESLNWSGLT